CVPRSQLDRITGPYLDIGVLPQSPACLRGDVRVKFDPNQSVCPAAAEPPVKHSPPPTTHINQHVGAGYLNPRHGCGNDSILQVVNRFGAEVPLSGLLAPTGVAAKPRVQPGRAQWPQSPLVSPELLKNSCYILHCLASLDCM